jgi:LPS sulfotransferase NodH
MLLGNMPQVLAADAPNPSRFIILCAARTGSTMLRHLLNSHPDACCHGEVMGIRMRSFVGIKPTGSPLLKKFEQLLAADPVAFMREFVLFPGDMKSVGFKILYNQLALPQSADVLAALREDAVLRIIHLKRANRLKRLVSHIAAVRVYGINLILNEADKPTPRRFAVSAEECLEDFQLNEAHEKQFADMFADHPLHEATYEDIVAPDSPAREEIQRFLGLEPRPLQTPTLKINSEALSEIVENYGELQARFRDTPYARFFE